MKPYVLSELAEEDLIQIYVTGAMDFGLEQAKHYHRKLYQAFDFLADNPFAGPERSGLRPACRIHPVGSHILSKIDLVGGTYPDAESARHSR